MSDRPTLETDNIARGNHVVPTEWAQQLERERDEAREALKHIEEYGTDEINAAVELRQKLAQTLIERDEARRKLNNLDVTAIHSCHNECQRPICVLRRERDEAREEANKLSGAYEDATNYYARIIELKEELDEAREALMKIEDLFIDGTDIYADRENMGTIARNALEGAK
jgi:chromosome segregation ATPase